LLNPNKVLKRKRKVFELCPSAYWDEETTQSFGFEAGLHSIFDFSISQNPMPSIHNASLYCLPLF